VNSPSSYSIYTSQLILDKTNIGSNYFSKKKLTSIGLAGYDHFNICPKFTGLCPKEIEKKKENYV
jgi:hypothetical protein